MSVTEAFRTVVFSCIAHLQANERGLLEPTTPSTCTRRASLCAACAQR